MRHVPLDHRPSRPLGAGTKVQVGTDGLEIIFGSDMRLWRISWIVAHRLHVSSIIEETYR
jgi:hypothetical protein